VNDDILSTATIGQGLGTRLVGRKILVYPELPSTNTTAKLCVLNGAIEGTVVIAESQLAGHGRFGRPWVSPQGNLALSIILYPEKVHMPFLIMVSALSVADTVEKITGKMAGIKWPNDVQVQGKKISGILIESGFQAESACYAVIGIGLNVNVDLSVFPELIDIATSMSSESGHSVSRSSVAQELLRQYERWYMALLNGGPIFEAWRQRLSTLGQAVCVTSGHNVFEGIATGVDEDGSLRLRQNNGEMLTFPVGDVSLRRS
jgi:BirA family transcriptional regulator, biotin operon repressor / biotin---[acetyl-CoA-carboxylase] ligase